MEKPKELRTARNPFAAFLALAVAHAAAIREQAYRAAGIEVPNNTSRSRGPAGVRNPAGAKFLLRAFKAKHGHKADSLAEAREWYAGCLAAADRAAHQRHERRRLERAARRNPLREAA